MWQDVMCADMSAYALGQDVMCTDTRAFALGVGTACEFQEPPAHPQMLSYFKELGHVAQDLCASHSPEGSEVEGREAERKEEEEEERIMSAAVKEIKEVMERQNGNIALLSEDIDMLKKMILELTRTANETVADLATEVRNLQNRWDEFIAEEEEAREEYAMYFQEQEELKNHLLERDRRLNRRLEQELRHEDHLGARTSASSTSPTRTEIHEFSDREYFDLRTREEEEQELFEENPDEYYSQSYPGAEEAGEAWTGEEEEGPWTEEEEGPKEEEKPKEKRKETQAEYDATRKELLAKARANEALKQKKRKQQEKGFKTPVDKGHEHKYYTEDGSIWKQNYKTGEKTWYNWDYKYKHEKGKGKEEYEKTG